jgi:hypothetical protein
MTIHITPKHKLPTFPSRASATWRDINGNTNEKYVVRPVAGGYVIVDTENGADRPSSSIFADEVSAREFMNTRQT